MELESDNKRQSHSILKLSGNEPLNEKRRKSRSIGFMVADGSQEPPKGFPNVDTAAKSDIFLRGLPSISTPKSPISLENDPVVLDKIEVSPTPVEPIVDSPANQEPQNQTSPVPTKPPVKSDDSFNSNSGGSSFNSSGSGFSHNTKILAENVSVKLQYSKMTVLAVLLNITLVVVGYILSTPDGFLFKIPYIKTDNIGLLAIVTLMFLIHFVTYYAMNDAIAVYFGIMLTQPKGYTLAVAGFVQASMAAKYSFPSMLPVRCKAKKLLNWISAGFFIHSRVITLALFVTLEMSSSLREVSSGSLQCIEYHQRLEQFDRGWPTFGLGMGVGEYVFGTSFGILRSQEDVPFTTFIMPPQLTDTCQDGTTISGNGFTANIFTECGCVKSVNSSTLVSAGIPAEDAGKFSDLYNDLIKIPGMVNGVYLQGETLKIISLLTRTNVCGSGAIIPVPVCTTTISEFSQARIRVVYMTDGTPASIAAKSSRILETKSKANITWLYQGYQYAMKGRIASMELPGLYPNTVNPLLWWTTSNRLDVSAANLRAGVETTISLLSKVVIQRSFGADGNRCKQSVVVPEDRIVKTTTNGWRYILLYAGLQFFVQILCCITFGFWMMNKRPILPALQFVRDKSFFTLMSNSAHLVALMADLPAAYSEGQFWIKFDVTMRIGESVYTLEDPDYGTIIVDKPKLVGDLSYSKYYS